MRRPWCGWTIGFAAVASLLVAGPASGQGVPSPGKPGNTFCLKAGEETPEIYGPTDVGATLAGGGLSVAVNPEGTLSVLRWPSRSYYEQLRYFTVDRDLPLLGLDPNEGAFSGLSFRLAGKGRKTVWLRELRSRQRYASDDSDSVVTSFHSRKLDFSVRVLDVVPEGADVLVRRHRLFLGPDSPVRDPRLIAFANLNPTASKRPILPTEDWCEEVAGTDVAEYEGAADAIVYAIEEADQSTMQPSSVAVAIGAGRRASGHQVGVDGYADHPSAGSGPPSAYDDAADGSLSGADRLGPGEVDAALELPLGQRPLNVVFAAAEDQAGAIRLLERYRDRDASSLAARKERSYLRWLREAPLPRNAPAAVSRLARRALISLRQAIEGHAGAEGRNVAIVASLTTQSPYFLDWIRDGAFFNEALERIGHHSLVKRHNLFYAETQKKLSEGAPPGTPLSACQEPTPDGNWFMTNYADGGDAGIFTWEIDEAAFGLWTLWRHRVYLAREGRDAEAERYLARIYPAIRRTADFLVAFRDPQTKLPPGSACEDDNPPRSGQPTMHSAGPVLLAMRSAEQAARSLGRSEDVQRYAARRAELETAINERYRVSGGAWTTDYGDGGWALWPVRVKPYADPRSRAQGEVAWEQVAPSFQAPDGPRERGYYELKALHGLAYLHRAVEPHRMRRVRRGLRWIAEIQAGYQGTGILGEVWYVRDGEVASVVAQPHVWEQVLFYLTALKAYGSEPYRPATRGS